LFMEWQSVNGKIVGMSYQMYSLRIILTCVVVLDEAQKYLINRPSHAVDFEHHPLTTTSRHMSVSTSK
jgi:hypothetical protein